MHDLDGTDMRILRLLAEDGRRPYSEIGDAVDLTPPAVSDRVSRLREAGVIRGFTIDVDRSQLRSGVPVLVRVEPNPDERAAVNERLRDSEAVEHVFTTAEGDITAYGRLPSESAYEWVEETVGVDRLDGYEVDLVADVDWTPSVRGTEFALDCVQCGNTVTSEGTSARVGGELRHFCCPTCETRFEERYEQLEEGV
ncbi:AsnC family transcriptional regulator [Candidatus Halobonum tyrrellensis]|uniref:Transcriptional regulator, AsnC family protein n=1 Tax=Candidatus Halobonum tyrrellensis G22 TaxID=1324957 RepID=V4IVK9_9EURY|nr:AsnC family transcriptional regulator [Candidatus Halobonum tyrrellensis]ESP87237.1 transcriptional regulator, AsnC family protein [Candidatus Halobonum tyrrellensis G22]